MKRTIQTENQKLNIRFAEEKDCALILRFIRELADYENLSHLVVATEEILRDSLFSRHIAEVIIGEYAGEAVTFALFFHNFSTFLGQPGIYLEDLYVKPSLRGKGFGKTMLSHLAQLTVERGCGRLEWSCLDWNEAAIKFYKNLGAKAMDEWTIYRVCDEDLKSLAQKGRNNEPKTT